MSLSDPVENAPLREDLRMHHSPFPPCLDTKKRLPIGGKSLQLEIVEIDCQIEDAGHEHVLKLNKVHEMGIVQQEMVDECPSQLVLNKREETESG